jgi:hypothetical protein
MDEDGLDFSISLQDEDPISDEIILAHKISENIDYVESNLSDISLFIESIDLLTEMLISAELIFERNTLSIQAMDHRMTTIIAFQWHFNEMKLYSWKYDKNISYSVPLNELRNILVSIKNINFIQFSFNEKNKLCIEIKNNNKKKIYEMPHDIEVKKFLLINKLCDKNDRVCVNIKTNRFTKLLVMDSHYEYDYDTKIGSHIMISCKEGKLNIVDRRKENTYYSENESIKCIYEEYINDKNLNTNINCICQNEENIIPKDINSVYLIPKYILRGLSTFSAELSFFVKNDYPLEIKCSYSNFSIQYIRSSE